MGCEYYEPLFRFAMSLTRAESDARELTRQTFHLWAKNSHQLRDVSKIKTWLFTMLHRAFLLAQRKKLRFPHHDLEGISEQPPAAPAEPGDLSDCSEVLSALARVDEINQSAVALFYLDDCSDQEIAAILELPIGTVKSRIARGIGQLKEIILSRGSQGPAPNQNRISSGPDTDELAPWAESTPPRPPRHAPVTASGYEEWDFSSTRLRELNGEL